MMNKICQNVRGVQKCEKIFEHQITEKKCDFITDFVIYVKVKFKTLHIRELMLIFRENYCSSQILFFADPA